MNFIYLFDLLDFGENGQVVATESYQLNYARSNFLYLIAKYNQKVLEIEKKPIPQFFKEGLKDLLVCVENETQDFQTAKKVLFSQCEPAVREIAEKATSDKEVIGVLNNLVALKDRSFLRDAMLADHLRNAINNKETTYYLTSYANSRFFDSAVMLQAKPECDAKEKSVLYKSVISYNSMIKTAELVEAKGLSGQQIAERK